MAAPMMTRPVSLDAEQDKGEGESMDDNTSGNDDAGRQFFGKGVAFDGGKTDRVACRMRRATSQGHAHGSNGAFGAE